VVVLRNEILGTFEDVRAEVRVELKHVVFILLLGRML
jgi:hypothetical protein